MTADVRRPCPARVGGGPTSPRSTQWDLWAFSGGNCKGRGSIHAYSHGLSAGDSRLSGRVDRRPRERDHLRGIARDPCSGGRADAYMAPSYSIGCAATEEHSWGAGDRRCWGHPVRYEREREREGGAPKGTSLPLFRRTYASLQASIRILVAHLSIRQSIPLVCSCLARAANHSAEPALLRRGHQSPTHVKRT